MGRPRRQIISKEVYEICMRTERGLPFVCTEYMQLFINSTLARVQRDHKVTLCHYLWMGNHPHIIIVAKDSLQCCKFYGELKKQLTEIVKRLLGINQLNLWKKNGTSVIRYGDKESVIKRIAYLYANPANANLVNSIDEYRGSHTYNEFQACSLGIEETIEKEIPWIRSPMIEKLPCCSLTKKQDQYVTSNLKLKVCGKSHILVLQPNAWMKAYAINDTSAEVGEQNSHIIRWLLEFEHTARDKRQQKSLRIKGANNLAKEPINIKFQITRTIKEQKIFIYAFNKKLRQEMNL